jgi:hypothetical protein
VAGEVHNRLLNRAARTVLKPAGLRPVSRLARRSPLVARRRRVPAFLLGSLRLAERARAEIIRYRELLPGLGEAAAILDTKATDIWGSWHAAAAFVLLDEPDRANAHLNEIAASTGDAPFEGRAPAPRAALRLEPNAAMFTPR